jgi:methylmalonyl-CoA/ethylmalonyl-CoA epimerase
MSRACGKRATSFLADEPSPGAHGSLVIFIHPRSCDGVLIELNQPADEH